MYGISKGIVCRICKHNKNNECVQGYTEPVSKKDECWTFQDRNINSGLAEHADANKSDWQG